MGRRKIQDRDQILSHSIIVRVTEVVYKRLVKLGSESDCSCVAEAARRILSNEKILLLHRDISLNGPMEELANIRKELKLIGININQITRHFNSCGNDKQKLFYTMKAGEQYQKVGEKVEKLLSIISKMAVKWLQS